VPNDFLTKSTESISAWRRNREESWQQEVYAKLLDYQWIALNTLFREIEIKIELHQASRQFRRLRPETDPATVSTTDMKWTYFIANLRAMHIEFDRPARKIVKPDTMIRLLPAGDCPKCQGKVFRVSWSRVTSGTKRCSTCGFKFKTPKEKLVTDVVNLPTTTTPAKTEIHRLSDDDKAKLIQLVAKSEDTDSLELIKRIWKCGNIITDTN
jgi:ribosomal protein L37AE/L43A